MGKKSCLGIGRGGTGNSEVVEGRKEGVGERGRTSEAVGRKWKVLRRSGGR